MSTLTRDQIKKAFDQMGDGWSLDRQMALLWGERVPLYRLDDEDGDGFTAVTLNWREVHETRTNRYGDRFHVATGTYRPVLNVSHYVRSGEMWASYGLGTDFPVDGFEPVRRRMFSQLARITRSLGADDLRELVAGAAAGHGTPCRLSGF